MKPNQELPEIETEGGFVTYCRIRSAEQCSTCAFRSDELCGLYDNYIPLWIGGTLLLAGISLIALAVYLAWVK